MADYNTRATGTGSGGTVLLVIGALGVIVLLLALFAGGPSPDGMAPLDSAAPDAAPATPGVPADAPPAPIIE